ncbi:aminotransferase class I/II-fold pyridoxal phosphate-dependent enzyme [Halorubrum sp. CBA1125]|uniref:pyridoxal phosphate-dependent aminotransferase n=1 Tax=Halorubrum sp. CBA1125 TaxID=2668072 RepID=UPI0012E8BC43|nr:pyridoxal phosphate-dependent aminotransferase [Halorubrum sp. CBA1125]MUW14721.1 aminotransferase class I/II-fold pyridoxal phosphate-dependent enzyme [Halorubrum sp. CBA1125]
MDYEEPKFFHVMQYAAGADRDVIDMVSGNPDWEPPAALREALAEYAEAPSESFQYPPSEGLRELREAIAARRNVDVDRVVVTNGTGEANYLAMARAFERDAGSEALLTDPVYPYYPGKVQLLGGDPTLVPTERDGGLDVEGIRESASEETALIVLNTPNNPTGAVYDLDAVREVAAVAEAVDALVVVDEVYDHFDLSGEFESALTLADDRVIVTSGFSKSMAITGFRVGYGVFPDAHVSRAKTRHMLVNVAGARPSQYAVTHALAETDPDYYRSARDLLADRVDAFTDALDAAGAEYSRPAGAFYVLARFDGFPGTMANVKRLIDEAGVAGMPGEAFGTARTDWIRFALVTPRTVEAAERLADYFDG